MALDDRDYYREHMGRLIDKKPLQKRGRLLKKEDGPDVDRMLRRVNSSWRPRDLSGFARFVLWLFAFFMLILAIGAVVLNVWHRVS